MVLLKLMIMWAYEVWYEMHTTTQRRRRDNLYLLNLKEVFKLCKDQRKSRAKEQWNEPQRLQGSHG